MDTNFLSVLFKQFPDIESTRQVSRAQIVEVMALTATSKYPTWLMQNRVGRGLYAVPTDGADFSKPETPVKPMAKIEDTASLVPKVDPNYVAFGNHRDIDTIIKSRQFYPAYIS